MTEFIPFPKIPRLRRDITITEKIDGTNASVVIMNEHPYVTDEYGGKFDVDYPTVTAVLDGQVFWIAAASRKQFIGPHKDNHGFSAWVWENAAELVKLGVGRHFGEWWGSGVNRGYGLQKGEKRFSLFNTKKWADSVDRPECVGVVPVLYEGPFTEAAVQGALDALDIFGSQASPGFLQPEGIIVYHQAANSMFKVTLENDEAPKGLAA